MLPDTMTLEPIWISRVSSSNKMQESFSISLNVSESCSSTETAFTYSYSCQFIPSLQSPHYQSKKVRKYFEENKDTLMPVYLPTASPEFMVMEEVWNIAKRDLLVLSYYQSFTDLKKKITSYFRTKRFKLDITNYLLADIHD